MVDDAPISSENRAIARHAAQVFGGTPRVDEYADAAEELTIGILRCPDRPSENLTSYSTVRLSDHPMQNGEGEFPVRIELAGVCATSAEYFPNVLASAAFTIMRSDEVFHPGVVLRDLVRQCWSATRLPHLYLTAPIPWARQLQLLDCGTKRVTWLTAIPISVSECAYLVEHGDRALEYLLENAHVDIADPDRSVVV